MRNYWQYELPEISIMPLPRPGGLGHYHIKLMKHVELDWLSAPTELVEGRAFRKEKSHFYYLQEIETC